MKHTKASAAGASGVPTLAAKERPRSPRTQCTERTELWYKYREADSCSAKAVKASLHRQTPTVFSGMKKTKNKKIKEGGSVGHPPLRGGPISPTLPEGDNRRQDAVVSRVSPDSFIFPAPHVHVAGLPHTGCARGEWRWYLSPGKPMKRQRFYTSEPTLFAQQRSHRQQSESEGSQVFSGHQAVGPQVRLK